MDCDTLVQPLAVRECKLGQGPVAWVFPACSAPACSAMLVTALVGAIQSPSVEAGLLANYSCCAVSREAQRGAGAAVWRDQDAAGAAARVSATLVTWQARQRERPRLKSTEHYEPARTRPHTLAGRKRHGRS
ncbi:hypothetical protein K458DRAFT_392300 [Lentithecium fluviatile CBS 122367]|uniref:Uncharacterized protein n=1 Tax=Lentithecium fluviatile CBS 122367 TaxID=1168545 RepID=A0A6G1IT04_9PLEO|nr:hypothetical protein K458DRAFT_392300 [Lentithecium fluviatile CBS 122367]